MRRSYSPAGLALLSALLLANAAFGHTAVAGEDNGSRVSVIDLSVPATPSVIKTVTTVLTSVQAIAIDPTGSRAVAVEKSGCRVLIIDITILTAPTLGPTYCSTFAGISSVAVSGTRAVIGEQSGPGVELLDITGAKPVRVGGVLNLPFTPVSALAASGTLAVATAGNGPQVAVINIGGISPVQVTGSPVATNYAGISSAAADAASAIVGQQFGPGVRPLTITGSPALGANLSTILPGVVSVGLVRTRALVGEANGGRVLVVDLTNVNAPVTVGLPLATGFAGISSVAAVVGMGWIGVVGQQFGPGVRAITGLRTMPVLGGMVNTPLVGISSIALTIFPPSAAAGHGDPHLTTVDGIHYDFQSAGEFVALRDADGMEIQTRQTPVGTASAVANAYTGLTTGVSINTAVAARVGKHRVTYEPNFYEIPDASGLQLRVDGVVTTLGANGLILGGGGHVVQSTGNGIEIDFPNGTILIVTPVFWSSQRKWFLDLDVFQTQADDGIMGLIAPGSWLPALPDGTSLGPKPAALHERYVVLYRKFADAWRVTDKTSLFDYAKGTSTATFTDMAWPHETPPYVIPGQPPVQALDPKVARRLCQAVVWNNLKTECIFDVTVAGDRGFAKMYLMGQRIQRGSTRTKVVSDKDSTKPEEPVTFTATVTLNATAPPDASRERRVPVGKVQFTLDGKETGKPVRLDSKGQARWKTSRSTLGEHYVAARYLPRQESVFLPSSSLDDPNVR
jgi:hypothetical protein